MASTPHLFGGEWTSEKLERVRKYLVAYATIMTKQRFRFAYVDAFAGTGYRTRQRPGLAQVSIIPELAEEEPAEFQDGSARIALQVEPRFNRYIFIEKERVRFAELGKLKTEFPDKADDIILVNREANAYIQEICAKDWIRTRRRAVMFLDPYGMQVEWQTIEAIARTQAIDLWILFPLAAATSRLLRRDGKINPAWRRKLDTMFGAKDWYDAFYRTTTFEGFFGEQTLTEKVANFDVIGSYFVQRLNTVFAGVAENPRPLYNSRNVPLYLLCFAAGNPKGAPTAIHIAQDILARD